MSQLTTVNNGRVVVSSRQVAENFDKRHDHILRTISDLAKDLPKIGEMFFEDKEPDAYGREQKVYLMDRDGFSLLVMGFTGSKALEWKLKYIEAFNQMEQAMLIKAPSYQIADPIERAKAWITEQEEKKALAGAIEELKPKAEFFDAVADSKTAIELGTAANVLGIKGVGRNKLFQFLRERGVLKENNEPYRKYIDLGYFRVIEQKYSKPDGTTHISIKTLVYQRGLDYIRKELEA